MKEAVRLDEHFPRIPELPENDWASAARKE